MVFWYCGLPHNQNTTTSQHQYFMNKIYHLSTCNTCQRIIKELGGEAAFELQNVKEQHISIKELDTFKKVAGSYEALFNKRAQKYRKQGLHEKDLSEADYKKLILGEYTFLKRPIVLIEDQIFIGNSKKVVIAAKKLLGIEA